jgi:uncharacterized repeat protein (TIGR03803 family)
VTPRQLLSHLPPPSPRNSGDLALDGLIFDQGGNLYGTAEGGTAGDGVVFQLAPNSDGSWKEKVLHNFTGVDGAGPYASLIFDQAGNLYGTTLEGGLGRSGVVFKLFGRWNKSSFRA